MDNDTQRNLRWRMWKHQTDAADAIKRLLDETLTELSEEGERLADHYDGTRDILAYDWVMSAIVQPLRYEQIRRGEAREAARVLLESNGHQVRVRALREPDQLGREWETSCTCGIPLGWYEDRDEADEEASDHAERYHGTVKVVTSQSA